MTSTKGHSITADLFTVFWFAKLNSFCGKKRDMSRMCKNFMRILTPDELLQNLKFWGFSNRTRKARKKERKT